MIIQKKNKSETKPITASKRRIVAADEDEEFNNDRLGDFDDPGYGPEGEDDDIEDAIDDIADNVEDLQDSVDEIKEDDVEISINNNIADHFIAECDKCNGIFISAVVDSDQEIDHVTGTCPLCGNETEQYLKWVIRSI